LVHRPLFSKTRSLLLTGGIFLASSITGVALLHHPLHSPTLTHLLIDAAVLVSISCVLRFLEIKRR
jgi:hypothetical protein